MHAENLSEGKKNSCEFSNWSKKNFVSFLRELVGIELGSARSSNLRGCQLRQFCHRNAATKSACPAAPSKFEQPGHVAPSTSFGSLRYVTSANKFLAVKSRDPAHQSNGRRGYVTIYLFKKIKEMLETCSFDSLSTYSELLRTRAELHLCIFSCKH